MRWGDDETLELGAQGRRLLTLREDKSLTPNDPQEAGLFHLAFLLPSRRDLAHWLRAAAEQAAPIVGASDHGVSEAVYLHDPDGNGAEIYPDRPLAAWPRDRQGGLAMKTDPLDLNALRAEAREAPPLSGAPYRAPSGTVLGHAHLQVGGLDAAAEFYEALGFERMAAYPGALFFGSGGYHHQLALNTWRSRGAGRRSNGQAGLAALRIARLGAPDAQTRTDPFGLTVLIEPR